MRIIRATIKALLTLVVMALPVAFWCVAFQFLINFGMDSGEAAILAFASLVLVVLTGLFYWLEQAESDFNKRNK